MRNHDDMTRELVDVERRGWNALCDGSGDVVYGELMTDDAVMVLASGDVMDRESVVRALGHAPPWRTYEMTDVRVIDLGPDSAALVYVGSAYREAADPAFAALMSSVYVRRDGQWKLAIYQQTPLPAQGA